MFGFFPILTIIYHCTLHVEGAGVTQIFFFFPKCPFRPWAPRSLLFNGGCVYVCMAWTAKAFLSL